MANFAIVTGTCEHRYLRLVFARAKGLGVKQSDIYLLFFAFLSLTMLSFTLHSITRNAVG
ncbi:hypothetical protein PAUR_a1112 [Pseudoalteromonas aurantia 208]|uniref:Uncharacterized protein n=1 Tax=Pseudoalteromonas aurantia 208 TaxID=1314867 RepID=A0ABR9E9M9_9GAMM|nr:hypothetical protein [Pseudoalteromonas aurantia 208]